MLEMKNVTKTFGDFKALDELSIRVPEGSVYGLVGPNGAGKTTVIRHFTGIYQPDSGTVILDGKGLPRCITRITKVEITPFRDITEEYAFIEGEGDKSLSYWKEAHTQVFTRECREDFGMDFTEDMECVCEYFEVVYQK